MKKRNPFVLFLFFVLIITLMFLLGSCNKKHKNEYQYQVIDNVGLNYYGDTLLATPSPDCIFLKNEQNNYIICGNYVIVSKK